MNVLLFGIRLCQLANLQKLQKNSYYEVLLELTSSGDVLVQGSRAVISSSFDEDRLESYLNAIPLLMPSLKLLGYKKDAKNSYRVWIASDSISAEELEFVDKEIKSH